jgi:hypothetical protein
MDRLGRDAEARYYRSKLEQIRHRAEPGPSEDQPEEGGSSTTGPSSASSALSSRL